MSPKDHPNDVPGVPMLFPPWLERLQIKYVNPVMTPVAKRLPGFTVIKHLAHGKTNWVKNVLAAGGAEVKLFRAEVRITNPRIAPAGTDDPALPWMARLGARHAGVLVAEIA